MSGHRFKPERTNGGNYFSDCACGWSGGVYRSRDTAKDAHTAHVEGRESTVGKVAPVVLFPPVAERGEG